MAVRFECAVIFVSDMLKARAFYEGALGRTVMLDHGANVVYVGGLSLWEGSRATRTIFREDRSGERWGRGNLELYFESDDLDAELAEVCAAGAELVHGIHEETWGQRTFRCLDPDGHIVEVAEPMTATIERLWRAGATPQSIAERTTMPMELVLQTIGLPRYC